MFFQVACTRLGVEIPHRITHRLPFDWLRDRLGFCLPAALRLAQAGDSPSRGEGLDSQSVSRVILQPFECR